MKGVGDCLGGGRSVLQRVDVRRKRSVGVLLSVHVQVCLLTINLPGLVAAETSAGWCRGLCFGARSPPLTGQRLGSLPRGTA